MLDLKNEKNFLSKSAKKKRGAIMNLKILANLQGKSGKKNALRKLTFYEEQKPCNPHKYWVSLAPSTGIEPVTDP